MCSCSLKNSKRDFLHGKSDLLSFAKNHKKEVLDHVVIDANGLIILDIVGSHVNGMI